MTLNDLSLNNGWPEQGYNPSLDGVMTEHYHNFLMNHVGNPAAESCNERPLDYEQENMARLFTGMTLFGPNGRLEPLLFVGWNACLSYRAHIVMGSVTTGEVVSGNALINRGRADMRLELTGQLGELVAKTWGLNSPGSCALTRPANALIYPNPNDIPRRSVTVEADGLTQQSLPIDVLQQRVAAFQAAV